MIIEVSESKDLSPESVFEDGFGFSDSLIKLQSFEARIVLTLDDGRLNRRVWGLHTTTSCTALAKIRPRFGLVIVP